MSVVHFTIKNKIYYADYTKDRPKKTEVPETAYIYDLQENAKGEVKYIKVAAYNGRIGSIVLNQQIPMDENKRAVISEIIFHDQLPILDESENDSDGY